MTTWKTETKTTDYSEIDAGAAAARQRRATGVLITVKLTWPVVVAVTVLAILAAVAVNAATVGYVIETAVSLKADPPTKFPTPPSQPLPPPPPRHPHR